jgi:hypothetical protein
MQVEKMGFPTAPLVTIAFVGLARSNAASRGMPGERICFLPHPMTNKSDEEMYKVLEGNDPITKQAVDAGDYRRLNCASDGRGKENRIHQPGCWPSHVLRHAGRVAADVQRQQPDARATSPTK